MRRSLPPLNRRLQLAALGLEAEKVYNADELKKAYREKVKVLHPDVPKTGNEKQFKAACDAYEKLSGKSQAHSFDFRPRSSSQTPEDPWHRGGTYYGDGHSDRDYQDPNANASTQSFYRNHRSAEGWTQSEWTEAKTKQRNTIILEWAKRGLLLYLLYLCFEGYRSTFQRQQIGITEGGYSKEYFERRDEDLRNGIDGKAGSAAPPKPVILPKVESKMDGHNPFHIHAATFKGQPFTTEGMAALRTERRRKKGLPPLPQDVHVVAVEADDVDCELD